MDPDLKRKAGALLELGMAIAAIASGNREEAVMFIDRARKTVMGDPQANLPGVDAPETKTKTDDARRLAVPRLFRYWQEHCHHPTAKLTPDRSTCILARLREGYTEAEIRKAIDGASVAAYVNEDNGQRYDDLTLICRSGSKLESFINRGVKATGELVADVTETSPIEDQIAHLRREMASYRKDGRTTEYEQAATELQKLMKRRTA